MNRHMEPAKRRARGILWYLLSILTVGLAPMGDIAHPVKLPAAAQVSIEGSNEKATSVGVAANRGLTGSEQASGRQAALEAEASWPMAAANPERTSWTSEEVRGQLRPEWFRVIEPYIPAKVQIIAANDTLYISTARGLYALDATTGAEKWVYPTEMPLGNSPTISNGIAYVGGFDNKLHAINALTGQGLWTFEAEAGFDTNPLVVNGLVYAGNRDGHMYAIYANESPQRGTLAWKYTTGGPIHFSAAYKNNTIYFASNDAYAYALDAATGALKWKSAKLPAGNGFHSWWPVIAGNTVFFSSSRGYRVLTPPQVSFGQEFYTKEDPPLFDDACRVSNTTPLGAYLPDGSMDFTKALEYLESKPWRRSFYLLDLTSGQEVTYDLDHDGKPEYAPLLNTGTNSGNRYPPLIGPDGTIYTFNHYTCNYGHVAGWKIGASSVMIPSHRLTAADEPLAYSAGGNVIYWNHCCDRSAGAFDRGGGQEWLYFEYNLENLIPGYDVKYMGTDEAKAVAVYGGWNGIYGSHGDQNPPIPYKGRVYMHRSNAVIAWSAAGGAKALPMSRIQAVRDLSREADTTVLRQKLASEITKIVDAGHLRPGLGIEGGFSRAGRSTTGDNLTDYWHNPLDTIWILTRALPHLPLDLQQRLRTYIQNEFTHYSPCEYTHIGWKDGAGREAFDLMPEVTADMPNHPPTMWSTFDFRGWTGPDWKWTPHTFYALWKYAQAFGGAKTIFDNCKDRLWTPPSDSILAEYPFAHNAWIAGYTGYLELEKLAGYPEEADKKATLNRLLNLRATTFTKDNPWGPDSHNAGQALSVARNFVFLTPELGQYLHDHALSQVQTAFNEYEEVAPYWFVTRFEATYGEDVMHHLYDYNGLFAAKAWIFQEQREELAKYLDVPAFTRGDLFYIQNLIITLEAPGEDISKTVSSLIVRQGEIVTYTLTICDSDAPLTQTIPITVSDLLPTGLRYNGGLCASSWGAAPACSTNAISWEGTLSVTIPVVISYTAEVTTPLPAALSNRMEVDAGSYGVFTRSVTILANPLQAYLPLLLKRAEE